MSETWFWGATDRNVACQKLSQCHRGTFLLRFGSTGSDFTISYIAEHKKKKEIFHTRVTHPYCSNDFMLPTTKHGNKHCKTLQDVVTHLTIKKIKSAIVTPCKGGPYEGLFLNSVDNGYSFHEGYNAIVMSDSDSESDEK